MTSTALVRPPITDAEALHSLRRHTRVQRTAGRGTGPLPSELPEPGTKKSSHIFRLAPRDIAFARARAELEGSSLTAVVEAAITAYAHGPVQVVTD